MMVVILKTSKKKKNNPLAPKIPLSSYMEFSVVERDKCEDGLAWVCVEDEGKEQSMRGRRRRLL